MHSWIKGSKALVFMEHLHKESEADEEEEALPSMGLFSAKLRESEQSCSCRIQ